MKSSLIYFDTALEKTWGRIKSSSYVETEFLGYVRLLISGYLLLVSIPRYTWLSTVPSAFFTPPYFSIANLFSDFPPRTILVISDILIIILLSCLFVGFRTRAVGLAYSILYFTLSSFAFSFGKIDHGGLYLHLSIFLLSFSNWGATCSIRPDRTNSRERDANILALLAIFFAFGLFTAGAEKAYVWIDFNLNTSGFIEWFNNGYYTTDRQQYLSHFVPLLPNIFYEIFDYSAVAIELTGFIFLLISRKHWVAWLTTICTFHLGTLLLLNINFLNNLFAYCVFLVPFALSSRKLKFNTISTRYSNILLYLLPAIAIPVRLYEVLMNPDLRLYLLIIPIEGNRHITDTIGLTLWTTMIFVSLFCLLSSREKSSQEARDV